MTIDQENPEHELDTYRIAEYLTIARLIAVDAEANATNFAGVERGIIRCPVCHVGAIAYALTPRAPGRKRIAAVCNTAGCLRFNT